ncbi:YjcZ family sporulation protein [Heyndrickxia acidiproducens]|uniref:YjcZ family sporulation protein n=1 Tax=Heyndrickxia acidiproducens TaxID=1121084 RepID=UPI00036E993D|nr:YjcZ family sporulation protein [Heyndrickxia acidiproducens]
MHYGHDGGYGYFPGYDCGCGSTYGYGYGGFAGCHRNSFALIVVLFILLIIIGACWIGPK